MDNIKKSELLELKTKLIKDIRGYKSSNGDAPDCFTMLHDYDKVVKNLTIPVVVGSEFTDCIKTVVFLKDETKATVYVPNNLDATEQLNYYDELFKKVGWWTWSKVN